MKIDTCLKTAFTGHGMQSPDAFETVCNKRLPSGTELVKATKPEFVLPASGSGGVRRHLTALAAVAGRPSGRQASSRNRA